MRVLTKKKSNKTKISCVWVKSKRLLYGPEKKLNMLKRIKNLKQFEKLEGTTLFLFGLKMCT